MKKLGDILTDNALASSAHITQALHTQSRIGGLLGDLLLCHHGIAPRALAQVVALQHNLPLVWLNQSPPDSSLFKQADLAHYQQWHMVPWRMENGVLQLATSHPSDALVAWARGHYGGDIALCVTASRDLHQHVLRAAHARMTRLARLRLKRLHPALSAAKTLVPTQARGLMAVIVFVASALLLIPETALLTALWMSNAFYLSTLCFKWLLYVSWKRITHTKPEDLGARDDSDLPTYSILVPMYKEPEPVIKNVIAALGALDYPAHKKEVFLLCEADDAETIAAIKAARPPEYCKILPVPPSRPRTKPKACNYALPMLRGEFVVIFDAEDRPEPAQLKKAVASFRARSDISCLQVPLNYYNRTENLLTKLFSIEYSALFRLQLPALERLAIPIPLGGTSNHIRRSALMEVGGWDAYNVTEDADLGIRLRYFGHHTAMLNSITLEESPVSLGAWLKQRSRWIKGYIQTWLVFTRNPGEMRARLGFGGYYGFQFFVGAPALTFILAPFFWAGCLFATAGLWHSPLPNPLLVTCCLSMLCGALSHWLYAKAAVKQEGWGAEMLPAVAVYPFYWLLHSVASFIALWQLATRPHYWAKTTHGVSKNASGSGSYPRHEAGSGLTRPTGLE